ncbi:zinc metalloprotease [Tenacibaculum salmonis]|uniref:peptidase, M50 family protein n=1 Tax=Tenacibaculum sp. P3-BQ1 TaxID=3232310 RepID=UPI0034DF696B
MKKELLVPRISKDVSFHTFSKDSYLIHQSKYNHRIKVTKETFDILNKIDNVKNLLTINSDIDNILDVNELFNLLFINFAEYGIIESTYVTIKKSKKPDYLKLSFILFPERLIEKITPYLKFLFQKKIMASILFVCFVLITTSVINNFDIIISQNFKAYDWLFIFILGFVSVTFHELGHATATSYFGAKHGGIGGGFYLFSPVYFADVSDIWKLKPSQRIVVNLAGIYFELIISSLYILIGFIWGKEILLITGVLIFTKSLLNLNPFLRSDGYWILSDATNIPNLHKISKSLLFSFIASLFKKNLLFSTSIKNIFLILYASINYMILLLFLGFYIFSNPESVVYFPYNFYIFVESIICGSKPFSISSITQFILPLLFYYLLFNLLKNLILRRQIKRGMK